MGEEGDGECCYNSCGLASMFGCDDGRAARAAGPAGPYGRPAGVYGAQSGDFMSGAHVAYPYYTNRGPRDFLMGYPPGTQPPSIGP
jgi:hypothetical protein